MVVLWGIKKGDEMNTLILVDKRIGFIYQAKVQELFKGPLKDDDGGYYVYPSSLDLTDLKQHLKTADIVLSVVAHKGKKTITTGDLIIDVSMFGD